MAETLALGLIVGLKDTIEQDLEHVAGLGLGTCQLSCWAPDRLDEQFARKVKAATAATGVRISSFWAGHSGKTVWNFLDGPRTIGLVPPSTRAQRLGELKLGSDFASMLDVPSITTHVGFIDEDPNRPEYADLVRTLQDLAAHCRRNGQAFCFETGQETPVTLLRTIQDTGTDNLGINLDPANLVLYGKANPVDALEVFGPFVQGVHAKDGLYPTDGRALGKEVPLGEGKVDFPKLIGALKELGYENPITIEREISGPQQVKDIKRAIEVLSPLL